MNTHIPDEELVRMRYRIGGLFFTSHKFTEIPLKLLQELFEPLD